MNYSHEIPKNLNGKSNVIEPNKKFIQFVDNPSYINVLTAGQE